MIDKRMHVLSPGIVRLAMDAKAYRYTHLQAALRADKLAKYYKAFGNRQALATWVNIRRNRKRKYRAAAEAFKRYVAGEFVPVSLIAEYIHI